jgi:hypothetical protein
MVRIARQAVDRILTQAQAVSGRQSLAEIHEIASIDR